jgi:hypothetical protein
MLSEATGVLNQRFRAASFYPLYGRDGTRIQWSNSSEKLWELGAPNPFVLM